jgi:2-polyprenyl-3-methyl-5-hydroxy-6-metoxy-1,4-benzoquinol methylase
MIGGGGKGMNFDEAARTWDGEERRLIRSKAVAERMLSRLAFHPGWRALDFGCGTGLLSFLFRDKLSEITLLDSSAGMIEVLCEKIERDDAVRAAAASALGARMRPRLGSVEELAGLGPFDLAYSMLALHHILDTGSVLRGLASALAPGASLLVVDLDAEDGSFHRSDAGFSGHNGFDRTELATLAQSAGFQAPRFEGIWVELRVSDGIEREYPLFLMIAERS